MWFHVRSLENQRVREHKSVLTWSGLDMCLSVHHEFAHFYQYYGAGFSHNDMDLSPGQSFDGSFRKSNSG